MRHCAAQPLDLGEKHVRKVTYGHHDLIDVPGA